MMDIANDMRYLPYKYDNILISLLALKVVKSLSFPLSFFFLFSLFILFLLAF